MTVPGSILTGGNILSSAGSFSHSNASDTNFMSL